MSAAYRGLHINTSRDRMEFSDFPMPRSYPDYPHHTQIAAYFDAYVDHFGVRDAIRFETTVAHARRGADGVWDLELADGSVERFDALVVANGHHWDPRWPEPMFPGHETFTGTQIHAHDYRDSDLFAGRRALILGMGNSAMDIAVESSHVAERTFLAARRGAWILPKYLFGRPVDQLPNDPRLPVKLRMRVFETMIRLFVGRPEKYGLPQPGPPLRLRAPDGVGADHRPPAARRDHAEAEHRAPRRRRGRVRRRHARARRRRRLLHRVPDQLPVLRRRRSSPRPTTASSCSGASCTRTSRTCSSSRSSSRSARPCRSPSARASGSATSCAASTCPPARAEMLRAIRAEDAAMRRRYVASKRHTIQVDFDDYLRDLEAERAAGAGRARAAGYALPVAPLAAGSRRDAAGRSEGEGLAA